METYWMKFACVSVFTMKIILMINVIGRYFFNRPVGIVLSITTLILMPIIVFMPLAWNEREDNNISIAIISKFYNDKQTTIINIVTGIPIILFVFLLAYIGIIESIRLLEIRSVVYVSGVALPRYISYIVFATGFIFLGVRLFINWLVDINTAYKMINNKKIGRVGGSD